jgi:hypothetical protein
MRDITAEHRDPDVIAVARTTAGIEFGIMWA